MRGYNIALYASIFAQSCATSIDQAIIDQRQQIPLSGSILDCDLPPPLDPSEDGLPSANVLFSGEAALKKQVQRHRALVQVPSISYDDGGEPGEDPRWDVFYQVHQTLAAVYPTVHKRATKKTVNTFGLVFTLNGSDPTLKPLLFTGHQDVVSPGDPSEWAYPPFSAHFDGRWIWGRGASDDKNSLTAIFSALETLLSHPSWSPKRTIIVALGFDEECFGPKGSGHIGPYLEELYGKNSMVLLLDEGGLGLDLVDEKTLYALPSVMEKGHLNVFLELTAKGGHSSVPSPHTAVGIMSEIVASIESNPFPPKTLKNSPTYDHFACQARYSPDFAPRVTQLIREGDLDGLTEELVATDQPTRYRLQTAQAVSIFQGGKKFNMLPENVKVTINYRVAAHDSIEGVKRKIINDVRPIVHKYDVALHAFEGEDTELDAVLDSNNYESVYGFDYNATLTITSGERAEIFRQSPSTGPVWDIFSGTIQHTFAFPDGRVVPVGESMTGNTDTRYYTNLTENIYRWVPTRKGGNRNAHSIDEGIDMHVHLDAVKFYYDLIRNFDASQV